MATYVLMRQAILGKELSSMTVQLHELGAGDRVTVRSPQPYGTVYSGYVVSVHDGYALINSPKWDRLVKVTPEWEIALF
jgi:hypothetical protein